MKILPLPVLARRSRGRPAACARGAIVPLLAAAFTFALSPLPASGVQAGDTAPVWVANDVDDRQVAFPEVLEGKPAVMVFWATWCPYCRAFMPSLESILEDYSDRGVKVVATNTREEADGDPKGYLRDLGFAMTGILGGDGIAADYDVHFIPGLMVVDGTGTVSWRRESTDLPAGREVAQLWSEEVRAALDAALASTPVLLPAP